MSPLNPPNPAFPGTGVNSVAMPSTVVSINNPNCVLAYNNGKIDWQTSCDSNGDGRRARNVMSWDSVGMAMEEIMRVGRPWRISKDADGTYNVQIGEGDFVVAESGHDLDLTLASAVRRHQRTYNKLVEKLEAL